MPRISVEDQFKKLQKQKIAIEQLEKTILDKDTKKSLQRVVAVIEKAVAAAFAIALPAAFPGGETLSSVA